MQVTTRFNLFHIVELIHVFVNYLNDYKQLYESWNALFSTTNIAKSIPLSIDAPSMGNKTKASNRIANFNS